MGDIGMNSKDQMVKRMWTEIIRLMRFQRGISSLLKFEQRSQFTDNNGHILEVKEMENYIPSKRNPKSNRSLHTYIRQSTLQVKVIRKS
jgi:hypothetical protein